jgi:aryl-alcohol dehydrogenase-like predicted oxidoreductase
MARPNTFASAAMPACCGWLLAQGEEIVPIPGTKRRKYLEENVAALNIELTPAELKEISAAVPPGDAAGMRYDHRQSSPRRPSRQ